MAVRSRKFLRCIRDSGKFADFMSYLILQNSIVVNEYARKFCMKEHLKPEEMSDKDYLERSIKIAHVSWVDKDEM